MRVAVVTAQTLFVRGGAELLAEGLTREIAAAGHSVELVRIPVSDGAAASMMNCMAAARLLELREFDRVVALKWPAFYVRHDHKVFWVLHQLRGVYDLWGADLGFPPTPEFRGLRSAVMRADTACFGEAESVFVNSSVTARRLLEFNGFESETLYPPLVEPVAPDTVGYGDYLFLPGRIAAAKRQWLAVKAIEHTRTPVRLLIAGPPDQSSDREHLQSIIRTAGLADRVTLVARWISHDEKVRQLAGALACVYLPFDEDSYGYVTLESFTARKAVVTCTDSGGTHELVRHEATGLICEPDPVSLAAAMDRLYADRKEARRLGESGFEQAERLGLSWPRVVERLLA